MKDYIDREAFIDAKRKQYCGDCDRRKGMKNGKMRFCYDTGEAPCRACSVDDILNDVEDFPAADVVEVRHGCWEERIVDDDEFDKYGFFRRRFYCSACGDWNTHGASKYCPHCGARMDGGADDAAD